MPTLKCPGIIDLQKLEVGAHHLVDFFPRRNKRGSRKRKKAANFLTFIAEIQRQDETERAVDVVVSYYDEHYHVRRVPSARRHGLETVGSQGKTKIIARPSPWNPLICFSTTSAES